MNRITFFKKHPDADLTPIVLLYRCHDGRLTYYTGEKIPPSEFPNKLNTGTAAQLDRIKKTIREMVVDYKVKGEPLTKAALKFALDKVLNKKKTPASENLFTLFDNYVDKMESGLILTPLKKRYSKGTVKTFRFTIEFLKAFDPNMTLHGTTLLTYHKFISYCQNKDYSTNYIGAQIKIWKTLGKMATGDPIFSDKDFKKIQEETFDVYLDEKELTKMFNLKLNSREALVRDWFILDCYTGLRVSDLLLLTKKNFSNGFITIANEKTDEKVVIPAHPFVKKIIERYNGFPPRVTDVEINRTIKKVAEKAKIEDEVLFTITKGGKRQDFYLKKWQMISNHSARRSLITNLLRKGVSETLIMKLTGIKSHNTIRRYNKMSTEEAAKIMSKHRFFK